MHKNDNRNIVIVTGSSGNIGKAISTRLIKKGYEVVGIDLKESNDELLDFFSIDLSDNHALVKVWSDIRDRYADRLYGLVNNAGIYEALNFIDLSQTDYDRVLNINLKVPVFMAQNFAKILMLNQRKGVIVNIASISGEIGSADVAYGISKGALVNLTKSLAIALAPDIRVNGVNPGVVVSKMASRIPDERMESYIKRTLNQSLASPDDISRAVSFLIDSNNQHVNSTTLKVDGGFH